ncbi:MAG: hypothetical protein ACJA1B_003166, partial [Polaribacter sp.]
TKKILSKIQNRKTELSHKKNSTPKTNNKKRLPSAKNKILPFIN